MLLGASRVDRVEKRKNLRKVSVHGPRRATEVETEVVCIDDGLPTREEGVDLQRVKAETEALGGGDILLEIEVLTRGERALDALAESTYH
ncbi:uncharacterized protein A4U43_C05F7080 [Asparagus officinalis]|uniref:Uncharacterized protein n=1 Tax=Asparagus officinalis TaxID=4686 RepID=A0A5P1EPY7_ASPOF|nr:uncharacterized protein A4U43_C05F7080 [Asparagus officinalis]